MIDYNFPDQKIDKLEKQKNSISKRIICHKEVIG